MRNSFSDHRSSSPLSTASSSDLSSSDPFEDSSDPLESPGPFLNPSTPSRGTRVWSSPGGADRQDFVIYEDLLSSPSPEVNASTRIMYQSDDDKENYHATSSDYEEHQYQPEEPIINVFDYDRMVDGTPLAIANAGPPPQRTLRADGRFVRDITPPVPVRNPVRIPVRFEEDVDGVPEEVWQSILYPSQVRDLRGLSEVLHRGEEQRFTMGRHFPMREENSQPSNNVLLEARRITSYQRSQARRELIEESDWY